MSDVQGACARHAETEAFERAKIWAQNPYVEEADRQDVAALLERAPQSPEAQKEIVERFYRELEFGTGGIRGILGMGNNRINKYNVRKATEALARTVSEAYPGQLNKVAISYDSRHFSFEFAKEAASVLAGHGIHAYIYKNMNPVALLSFAVRHLKAQAGVMVTASHNPPQYNGYKVFWSDGAQVTPPHDQKIIDAYYAQKDFASIRSIPFEEGVQKKLIHWMGPEVEDQYYRLVLGKALAPERAREKGAQLKIIYTPIHGTGLLPCTRIMRELGFTNFQVVEEQARPDGSFPTVKKGPNPENPEALTLAVGLMERTGADIVFGTDPDTDRLGVAVPRKKGGIFYPNGNQIGVLMLDYILSTLSAQGRLPKTPYMVKTIVTTRMLDVIAEVYGVKVENTLTGFKWICRRMNEVEREHPDWSFLFATEESFGYMHHDYVRDKDAVSSLGLMAEVALYHKLQGRNLEEALDAIYEKYGLCQEFLVSLDYLGKEGAEKIGRIMERFRADFKVGGCRFAGEEVVEVEDYRRRKALDLRTRAERALIQPESNVLGLAFASGHRLYLRPSGTEPKIKFYIMMIEKEGTFHEKKERAQKRIDAFVEQIKKTSEGL